MLSSKKNANGSKHLAVFLFKATLPNFINAAFPSIEQYRDREGRF